MRISDWSSDVCSSDLPAAAVGLDEGGRADQLQLQQAAVLLGPRQLVDPVAHAFPDRQRVQVQAAGLEGVVSEDQVVAAIARNDVPVTGRNCQPDRKSTRLNSSH